MFKINDYVICSGSGVCVLKDINKGPIEGDPKEYFILEPVNAPGNRIYVPTTQDKIKLRKLADKDEVLSLIQNVPILEEENENNRQREAKYKSIIFQLDVFNVIKLIKTLYVRTQKRLAEGKKATHTDQKYFKLATQSIHEELSLVLDIPKENIEDYILENIVKDSNSMSM